MKREFYAYMPVWLHELVDRVTTGLHMPRRESVSRRARKAKLMAPEVCAQVRDEHVCTHPVPRCRFPSTYTILTSYPELLSKT